MNGHDYLHRGNSHFLQHNKTEAISDWKEARRFGIREAYLRLWEHALHSPDLGNSDHATKDKVISGVKNLLTGLRGKKTFENLVRHVISIRGQAVAENIFKSLQFGWEENGHPTADYPEVYYNVFSSFYTDQKLLSASTKITARRNPTLQTKPALSDRLISFLSRYVIAIAIAAVLLYFIMLPLIERLTPVETLAWRIHEKSKYKFSGAIYNDGWTSHSQGRGTCSWHNGVDYYFNKGDYAKSIEECRQEARDISWLSP